MSICDLIEDGTFRTVYDSPSVSAQIGRDGRARINAHVGDLLKSAPIRNVTPQNVDQATAHLANVWSLIGGTPIAPELAKARTAVLASI